MRARMVLLANDNIWVILWSSHLMFFYLENVFCFPTSMYVE